MTQAFSNNDDTIDVRDIIARVEELESEQSDDGEKEELETLTELLDELKGTGGDEEWRGDWYPLTMIRDSHFEDYAQELAEECGDLNRKPRWPYTCIDWEKAARELQYDYTSVDYNGTTYWVR